MNIAFSTIVLILFLLPGLVFRRSYFTEEFSKQYFKASPFAIFISSFIPSLAIHLAGFYLIKYITSYHIDLSILIKLFTDKFDQQCTDNIKFYSTAIIQYNISLVLIASILGALSKRTVRQLKLDRKYKMFRFRNAWHYIITGELFDFPRVNMTLDNDDVKDIELVFCNVLIELNNISYLYDGVLVDYELNENNGLSRVSLANVQRRKLDSDENITLFNNNSRYYHIKGHVMIFEYSKVKNINFSYYTVRYDNNTSSFNLELVS